MKMSSIRIVQGLTANLNLKIQQLDVKIGFLHGDPKEEIYMEQLKGFSVKGKKELVCKLKKSLYGLKQAPRQWYKMFDSFIENHGFDKTTYDLCAFVKKFGDGDFIILSLYVDGTLNVGQDASKIDKFGKRTQHIFCSKELETGKTDS